MLAERAGAPRLLILLAVLTIAAIAVFVRHHRAHHVRRHCGCQVQMHERFMLVSSAPNAIVIWSARARQ